MKPAIITLIQKGTKGKRMKEISEDITTNKVYKYRLFTFEVFSF